MKKYDTHPIYTLYLWIMFMLMMSSCQPRSTESQPTIRDCLSSGTLERLVECLEGRMPGRGKGYVAPTAEQQEDLQGVMRQMLAGETQMIMPASLLGIMEVIVFNDGVNGQNYTVLLEVGDNNKDGVVDLGLGTFMVNNHALRELNIAAPHVGYEPNTREETIGIFKASGARSFLMAGAHRYADSRASACQSDYPASDAVHNTDNMFFAATGVLQEFYGISPWYQLQFHGFNPDICPEANVNISHGNYRVRPVPGDVILVLRDHLLAHNPSWQVATDGGTCAYDGGNNTSGRLLNGVPAQEVCHTDAKTFGPVFIHIEQQSAFRSYSDWIESILETFPPGTSIRSKE